MINLRPPQKCGVFFCAIIKLQQRATSRHLRGQTRIPIYQGFCVTGKNSLTGKYHCATWSFPGRISGATYYNCPIKSWIQRQVTVW